MTCGILLGLLSGCGVVLGAELESPKPKAPIMTVNQILGQREKKKNELFGTITNIEARPGKYDDNILFYHIDITTDKQNLTIQMHQNAIKPFSENTPEKSFQLRNQADKISKIEYYQVENQRKREDSCCVDSEELRLRLTNAWHLYEDNKPTAEQLAEQKKQQQEREDAEVKKTLQEIQARQQTQQDEERQKAQEAAAEKARKEKYRGEKTKLLNTNFGTPAQITEIIAAHEEEITPYSTLIFACDLTEIVPDSKTPGYVITLGSVFREQSNTTYLDACHLHISQTDLKSIRQCITDNKSIRIKSPVIDSPLFIKLSDTTKATLQDFFKLQKAESTPKEITVPEINFPPTQKTVQSTDRKRSSSFLNKDLPKKLNPEFTKRMVQSHNNVEIPQKELVFLSALDIDDDNAGTEQLPDDVKPWSLASITYVGKGQSGDYWDLVFERDSQNNESPESCQLTTHSDNLHKIGLNIQKHTFINIMNEGAPEGSSDKIMSVLVEPQIRNAIIKHHALTFNDTQETEKSAQKLANLISLYTPLKQPAIKKRDRKQEIVNPEANKSKLGEVTIAKMDLPLSVSLQTFKLASSVRYQEILELCQKDELLLSKSPLSEQFNCTITLHNSTQNDQNEQQPPKPYRITLEHLNFIYNTHLKKIRSFDPELIRLSVTIPAKEMALLTMPQLDEKKGTNRIEHAEGILSRRQSSDHNNLAQQKELQELEKDLSHLANNLSQKEDDLLKAQKQIKEIELRKSELENQKLTSGNSEETSDVASPIISIPDRSSSNRTEAIFCIQKKMSDPKDKMEKIEETDNEYIITILWGNETISLHIDKETMHNIFIPADAKNIDLLITRKVNGITNYLCINPSSTSEGWQKFCEAQIVRQSDQSATQPQIEFPLFDRPGFYKNLIGQKKPSVFIPENTPTAKCGPISNIIPVLTESDVTADNFCDIVSVVENDANAPTSYTFILYQKNKNRLIEFLVVEPYIMKNIENAHRSNIEYMIISSGELPIIVCVEDLVQCITNPSEPLIINTTTAEKLPSEFPTTQPAVPPVVSLSSPLQLADPSAKTDERAATQVQSKPRIINTTTAEKLPSELPTKQPAMPPVVSLSSHLQLADPSAKTDEHAATQGQRETFSITAEQQEKIVAICERNKKLDQYNPYSISLGDKVSYTVTKEKLYEIYNLLQQCKYHPNGTFLLDHTVTMPQRKMKMSDHLFLPLHTKLPKDDKKYSISSILYNKEKNRYVVQLHVGDSLPLQTFFMAENVLNFIHNQIRDDQSAQLVKDNHIITIVPDQITKIALHQLVEKPSPQQIEQPKQPKPDNKQRFPAVKSIPKPLVTIKEVMPAVVDASTINACWSVDGITYNKNTDDWELVITSGPAVRTLHTNSQVFDQMVQHFKGNEAINCLVTNSEIIVLNKTIKTQGSFKSCGKPIVENPTKAPSSSFSQSTIIKGLTFVGALTGIATLLWYKDAIFDSLPLSVQDKLSKFVNTLADIKNKCYLPQKK